MMHPTIKEVTERVTARSRKSRELYLERIEKARRNGVTRKVLGCSNLAHGMAASNAEGKADLAGMQKPNIAIVTAYNDMLSAHEPFKTYPPLIKRALLDAEATGQVAGGVPAMCDGITQSQPGMELSLFSRDNIAMGTAIALSHNMFDGVLCLGVCDKIVPGLLIGALAFGHLPAVFIPAGPMPSGISNAEKAKVRQEYARGKVGKETLLDTEAHSYHSPGTCTFYGTANSNQMLMEVMGLHLPGTSFVNAETPLRDALTQAAAKQVLKLTSLSEHYLPVGKMLEEKSFVNAIVGLLATGGSTNHTLHLVAMARSAGIVLTWDDFDALSKAVPLLTKMYPNGSADVNDFQAAGGMAVVIRELLEAGLLHEDVHTIMGFGLSRYIETPSLREGDLAWHADREPSRNPEVIGSVARPFDREGGLRVLGGNIGRSVIKTSALKPERHYIEAEAVVFDSQEALQQAFKRGELDKDFVAVVRFQGPRANGMPELHGLMAPLGALQDMGYRVAILTDGRMSGASGKVPSAIHMTPEASVGGVIGKIRDGDIIRLDIESGRLELLVDEAELAARAPAEKALAENRHGMGRELFAAIRAEVAGAEEGAGIFDLPGEERC
jgi:phosphogluconate dehydratase